MRYKKLVRYLKKWQSAGLISEEQVKKISEHIKAESHRQFLKLIRVLFIIGAFYVVFGLVATLKLINIDFFLAIGRFLYKLVTPIIKLAKLISPKHYPQLLGGIFCLAGWGLFHWLGIRLRKKSDVAVTKLGFLQERGLRLGTSSFVIGYILASAGWQFFNYMIYPANPWELFGEQAIFPFFSVIGLAFFFTIAYLMRDQIALLFGIGFMAHAVGLCTVYYFACYAMGVQMPIIQLLLGVLLIFVGLEHIAKVRGEEDKFQFLFGRTYEAVGLIFAYLSLWVMSMWGFYFREDWAPPTAGELWATNLLFIGGSVCALFYGAAKEDRMFFNFGLTFLIIETYTVFFSVLWETIGAAFGSLILGIMFIATGYLLRYLWLRGFIFKRTGGPS